MESSFLFTPGPRIESLKKLGADPDGCHAVVIDLEDSVHPKMKQRAREAIAIFDYSGLINKNISIGLRINSITTGDGIRDLLFLKETFKDLAPFGYVMLPKVSSPQELALYRKHLDFDVRLFAIIETLEAVDKVDEIASEADALVYGEADLKAQLYAPNPYFLQLVKAKICAAASKYSLNAIDTNSFEIKDLEYFQKQCQESKDAGFLAKAAIHPTQLKIINRVFSHTEEEIFKYKSVISEYTETLNGFQLSDRTKIIAPPFVAKAKRMLELYEENICERPDM